MGAFDLVSEGTNGLPIDELLLLYLGQNKREEARKIGKILWEHRTMLWDFFSIKILANDDSSPLLASIPCLIDGYMPELEGLPHLLFQLGQINYADVSFGGNLGKKFTKIIKKLRCEFIFYLLNIKNI